MCFWCLAYFLRPPYYRLFLFLLKYNSVCMYLDNGDAVNSISFGDYPIVDYRGGTIRTGGDTGYESFLWNFGRG